MSPPGIAIVDVDEFWGWEMVDPKKPEDPRS
jgi:hypothetical protein